MVKKIVAILLVSALLLLYFITELNKKNENNWQMNFSGLNKDPYGCYVLRKTLEEHDSLEFLRSSNETFYKSISKGQNPKNTTLIVITDKFEPDSINLSAAYRFVRNGNKMFISAYSFGSRFCDSMNFEVDIFNFRTFMANTDTLNFTNPLLKFPASVAFNGISPSKFKAIDTLHHTVTGTNNAGEVNFISIPYGNGTFFIHCQPLVFTNVHMLYSNPEYPYRALSYFKNDALVWDDYYKPENGRYFGEDQTLFRYLLSKDALRTALYLILILIALYFFIESKRRQRYLPILQPPANSTVSFVNTIARLYQGQPDYKKMVEKKYLYFKEIAYSRYLIRLDENNPQTAIQFSDKAGIKVEKIKELFILYRRIESSISIGADTLIAFSALADEIYGDLDNYSKSSIS